MIIPSLLGCCALLMMVTSAYIFIQEFYKLVSNLCFYLTTLIRWSTLGILFSSIYCQTHLFVKWSSCYLLIFSLYKFESFPFFCSHVIRNVAFKYSYKVPSLKIDYFFTSFLFDHFNSTVKERTGFEIPLLIFEPK